MAYLRSLHFTNFIYRNFTGYVLQIYTLTYRLNTIRLPLILVLFLTLIGSQHLTAHPLTGKKDNTVEDPYQTKQFTVDGPGVINVSTINGDISVERMPYIDKVIVELYVDRGYAIWSGSKNLENYRITAIQRGNEITASVEPKNSDQGLFSNKVRFSYKIYVPESMSTHLKTSGGHVLISGLSGSQVIKTGGGNIVASDIKGKISAFTAGGNIDITFAKGTIFARTEAGNITIEKSEGELRLKANGGQIKATRISGSMLAQVAGGHITADFISITRGVNLSSSFGDINLTLPKNEGYDLDLKGRGVFIPSSQAFSGTNTSNRVEGKLSGGGPLINLVSDAGEITLLVVDDY